MKERLPDGRNFVDNDGNVRSMADRHDDEIAASYDELPADDRKQLDKIIHHIEPAKATPEQEKAFAEGALFLLDADLHPEPPRATVEQQPPIQNIEQTESRRIAEMIIQDYDRAVAQLKGYKSVVNTSAIKRDARIATIRNLRQLTPADREAIAEHLGHAKDLFSRDTITPDTDNQERPRD